MNRQEKIITDELTEKQKTFCREYILHWNATKAAIKAGYSEDTARSIGSENLTKPNIQSYITYLKANLAEVAEVSPLMILNEYKKIAFSSIAHLHLNWIVREDFELLTDDQKACIQEIDTKVLKKNIGTRDEPEIVDIEYVKIKLYDKLKGLEGINKMLGYDAPAKIDHTTQGEKISITPIEWVKSADKDK